MGPPIIPLHDNRVIQVFCGLLLVGPPIIKRFVVEDVPSHFNNLVDFIIVKVDLRFEIWETTSLLHTKQRERED